MKNIVCCPKCKNEISIDLTNAIDELGEIYICPKCKWNFWCN